MKPRLQRNRKTDSGVSPHNEISSDGGKNTRNDRWLSVSQKEPPMLSRSICRRIMHGKISSKRGPRRTRLKKIESVERGMEGPGIILIV